MTADRVRRSFRITGRVQGVGYRWFAMHAARQLELTGWVRNDPDGAVSGEVQGAPAAVDELLDRLRRGPPAARVDDLAAEDVPVTAGEAGFSVSR